MKCQINVSQNDQTKIQELCDDEDNNELCDNMHAIKTLLADKGYIRSLSQPILDIECTDSAYHLNLCVKTQSDYRGVAGDSGSLDEYSENSIEV